MTSNSSVTKLLPKVRRAVLELAEQGEIGFGLSFMAGRVASSYRYCNSAATDRRKFTSGYPKSERGHVQTCLSILAREGVMYGRNHTEPGVMPFGHGETDKRFRIRVTPEQARKRLAQMK